MTNEQLTAYLLDESYLYSVGYEELKTLVMQYPYSANLRILLLKKSYLDKHKDYDRNLQMSSTYSTNRKHLYKTIKRLKSFKLVPQNVILGEEYLELTELSNIERLLAERYVSQAVQTATKLDSLAPDWKLEIDDIAFNDDSEKGQPDLSNLSQNKEKKSKKNKTDDDEIDFLINSLVSEYNEPASDIEPILVLDEEKETLEIVHTTHTPENPNVDFEEFVEEQIEDSTLLELSDSTTSSNESFETAPEDILFGFINEKTENVDKEEIIDGTEIINKEEIINHVLEEKENIEPQLDLIEAFPKDETTLTTIDKESEEDVKKSDIQLEIINSTKAPIVEKQETKQAFDKKPSFTEWLSQFRITPPQSSNFEAKSTGSLNETLDNQIVTTIDTEESIRKISRQSMVEIFETKSEVPDNLYGLANEKSPLHFVEDDEDDEDDEDEVFSEYESNPNKKKKNRPMHQLAIKSLVQDDELVSETLADLLAWQGNKVKATEMYRKLILQFPEKSSYFATKIEKISI